MPDLVLADIRKEYRSGRSVLVAVNSFSCRVEPGRTVAVVGESGSGKTTVALAAMRLIEPTSGSIRFGDMVVSSGAVPVEYRRAVQMIFQNPLAAFNPRLTIGSSLADAFRLRPSVTGKARMAEISDRLEEVGLSPEIARRYPRQVSGGQLQRAGIARALLVEPSVLVLDEPTSALDMSIRGQIVELLLRLQQQRDLSMLLISHDMRVVRAMSDSVVVMRRGNQVEVGATKKVLAHPEHEYTQMLMQAVGIGKGW